MPDSWRRCRARSITALTSARPACTALSSSNAAPEAPATIRASVVLPLPGGPCRIIECGCPDSIARAQRRALGQQVALADELLEGRGAHPGGERRIRDALPRLAGLARPPAGPGRSGGPYRRRTTSPSAQVCSRRWRRPESLSQRAARSVNHPLTRALLVLTFTTGLVDGVSYLGLGHVFTANMTGNIVLLGFGLAGGTGLPVVAPIVSLLAFLVGAGAGGVLAARLRGPPSACTSASRWRSRSALLTVAAVFAAVVTSAAGAFSADVVIALLALAMGVRNATVRKIAVPDLTTTVLTMTLTGLAADSTLFGGSGRGTVRRISAVVGDARRGTCRRARVEGEPRAAARHGGGAGAADEPGLRAGRSRARPPRDDCAPP